MKAHGAQFSLPTERYGNFATSAYTSSGYRNLFGDASPDERYRGFGTDEESRRRNRRMFRWLAERLGRAYAWPGGGSNRNSRIPAGYTYLGQFVIHDTIQSLADLPDLHSGTDWLRNDRSGRLVLDTIYGKGPGADPLLYGACPALAAGNGFLRISGRREGTGPLRDLPRSPCPFTGKAAHSDVLIGDARNDDNIIVAQLTVLFYLLHNIVYGELRRLHAQSSDSRVFALARKVVIRIYREIVRQDLLERLLLPEIYRRYMAGNAGALSDMDDLRMPLEFSHAAARFGHFMVRDEYKINAGMDGTDRDIKSILRLTSASQPWDMPLRAKWLIDWATLFDKAGAPGLRSRRLGPEVALPLVRNDLFRDIDDPALQDGDSGGLAYRDLVRGCESNLRSVGSIVALLPEWVRDLSVLVRPGTTAIDTTALAEWLQTDFTGVPQAPTEYVNRILEDIPLLLFIVVEAAATSSAAENIRYGECLGAVGSFILAEFFFREYWRTYPLIEADEEVADAQRRVFGVTSLNSMPNLIAEIARRKDWGNVSPKFW